MLKIFNCSVVRSAWIGNYYENPAPRGNMDEQLTLHKYEYTIRARQVLKRTAEDIIELSQICHEYHQEFGYQEYIQWVKIELSLSKTYGCNLLNVYEKYGSSPHYGLNCNFDSSAIRLLAESS